MSSKGDRGARAGFTLVEVLVALVVAGFLLPSLARALGQAWTATRTPMDVVSAMTLARGVAAGGDIPPDARRRGFAAERTEGSVTVKTLPSDVAPAPAGTGDDAVGDLKPTATPSAMKLALPKGLGGPETSAANVRLRRVSVVLLTPAGRRITLDAVRLDDTAR